MKSFCLSLVKTHGKEKALKMAQGCYQVALNTQNNGGIHYADEIEAMKKRRQDPKPSRLHKSTQFWRQAADIIKKINIV